MPASAPQHEPTDDRYVVRGGDRCFATWAGGARSDHRKPAWHPVDTDVQKASEDEAEDEGRRREDCVGIQCLYRASWSRG
jgi:hypothetical protein